MTREIELGGVSVEFEGRRALHDVSVRLSERHIGVIGSNGSGKSTFARLLNGLVVATSGSVAVHGINPARRGRDLRRDVGFVFSNPDAQIIMPTVAEDVAFSLRGSALGRDEIRSRVASALEEFALTEHPDAPAHSLSGGQKQLLALAAILVKRPALVIADEPTASLDASNTKRVAAHLFGGDHQLVLVTHDLRLAARCDVVLWFENSRLIARGEPARVIADYERAHA